MNAFCQKIWFLGFMDTVKLIKFLIKYRFVIKKSTFVLLKNRICAREVDEKVAYNKFWSTFLNRIYANLQIKRPHITRAACTKNILSHSR